MNRQVLGNIAFLPQVYYGIQDLLLYENRIVVMMFHHIEQEEYPHFQALMRLLYEKYQVITPEEFEQCLAGKKLKGRCLKVFLSFDDGFRSDYTVAQDILAPYDMKAVHFIAPGFINSTSETQIRKFVDDRLLLASNDMKDFLPMNWEQIHLLQNMGHKIGAHTCTHLRCNGKDTDVLEQEICGSGDFLSKKIRTKIDWFAFPFGDIHSIGTVAAGIAQKRYRYVFSAIRGYNQFRKGQRMLYREAVAMSDQIRYVQFILEGGLMPYYRKARNDLQNMVEHE